MMLVLPMACLVLLGLALTFRVHPHLFWGIVASLAVGGAAFALNLAKISAEAHSGPGILGLVDPRVSGLAFLFGSFAAVAYTLFGILMRAFAQLRWPPVVFHVLALGLAGVMVASFLGVAFQVQEFAHFQKRRRHPHYATSTAGVNREPSSSFLRSHRWIRPISSRNGGQLSSIGLLFAMMNNQGMFPRCMRA